MSGSSNSVYNNNNSANGAINTTPASQLKPAHLSYLLHASTGLHKYPNYLSRWSLREIDELEGALEEQLKAVREQKRNVIQRRNLIQAALNTTTSTTSTDNDSYINDSNINCIKQPESWSSLYEILTPEMVKCIRQSPSTNNNTKLYDILKGRVPIEYTVGSLEKLMQQEMFDVYSLPFFNKDFCKRLVQSVKQISNTLICHNNDTNNNDVILDLKNRPINLDEVGLSWVNDLLFHMVLQPISRHLFQSSEYNNNASGDNKELLDWRHGYIAGYAPQPTLDGVKNRSRLIPHTDDSEVTLNICLSDEFAGGELSFTGLRGTMDEGKLLGEYKPQMGRAILHAGRHLHEVKTVTSGERYVLIVWARSRAGARSNNCPCCWLNRRRKKDCICGPKWNPKSTNMIQ